MAAEIFNRQEIKFVISKVQYEALQETLRAHMHLDAHNVDGKTYRLYNLYFDTTDHSLIRHSLDAPEYKEKIRIRSYHELEEGGKVFLEIKKRFKKTTNKRRSKLAYEDAVRLVTEGRLPKPKPYMNWQVVQELHTLVRRSEYVPKTFITYDRLAYHDSDPAGDLRITFDSGLTCRRFDDMSSARLLSDGMFIMEVKSCFNMPLWLVSELSHHGIYKRRYSKYGQEYLGYIRRKRLEFSHAG